MPALVQHDQTDAETDAVDVQHEQTETHQASPMPALVQHDNSGWLCNDGQGQGELRKGSGRRRREGPRTQAGTKQCSAVGIAL